MTNKDKAKEMTKGFLNEGLIKKSRLQELLMKAMQWKEKKLIDKACEWWESELAYPTMTRAEIDDFVLSRIKEFKQAMKGDEE